MLIPAKEQGLPLDRFDPTDRLVPRSRAPTDANSQTVEPWLPTEAEQAAQRAEQPAIGYTPDAKEAALRQAWSDYLESK